MDASLAIDLLFSGLPQLGPGSDATTLNVLRSLPTRNWQQIVDVGCGNGRQTLALAREVRHPIDAVDNHAGFLAELQRRAEQAGLGDLVRTYCLDMAELANQFHGVDLLWSEGAAYNLGFGSALQAWRSAMSPGGFAVVSECTWLVKDRPSEIEDFWSANYPLMGSIDSNGRLAVDSGFRVCETRVVPQEDWRAGYYNELHPRATQLLGYENETVRHFAQETLREIDLFSRFGDCYGYVFYVLEAP